MAASWAAPPPGYPAGHGQAYGGQPPAAPQPQAATAVAVTAASNGVGNPYVMVTPAATTPSTCQSTCLNPLLLVLCAPPGLNPPAGLRARLLRMRCVALLQPS